MLNNLSIGTIFMLIKMTLIILIIINVICRFKNADGDSTKKYIDRIAFFMSVIITMLILGY